MVAGAEIKTGGMKMSGKGKIKGEHAKKAMGEAMEPLVASLTKSMVSEKGKTAKTKKTKEEDPIKELRKDIAALLG